MNLERPRAQLRAFARAQIPTPCSDAVWNGLIYREIRPANVASLSHADARLPLKGPEILSLPLQHEYDTQASYP